LFDVTLTPVYVEAGQERKEFPGLFATAPQKASRLRAADRVILFLGQAGSAPLAPKVQQELLSRLSETYYTSTGPVTSGMKAMAERLNEFLIRMNLNQSRQQGGQSVGLLNMVVLHGSSVYVAHAGQTHTYLVSASAVEHFTDTSGSGRGLGLAKLVSLRYYQATVSSDAYLLFCSDPCPVWSETALHAAAQMDFGGMRKHFMGSLIDLQAGLAILKPGKGEVRWFQPAPAPRPAAPTPAEAAPSSAPLPSSEPGKPEPSTLPETPVVSEAPVEIEAEALAAPVQEAETVEDLEATSQEEQEAPAAESSETASQGVYLSGRTLEESDPKRAPWEEPLAVQPAVRPERPAPIQAAPPVRTPAALQVSAPAAQPIAERPARKAEPSRPQAPSPAAAGAARAASGFIGGVRKASGWLGSSLNKFAARVLPDQPPEGVQLSASTMLFIALAVPVVVVAMAATIYAQRGRGEMHAAAVQAALQYAETAATRQDVPLRRRDWLQALSWLDKADGYGQSQQATDLRSQVQTGLDNLDGITRLDYRPALSGPMGENTRITRMIAATNDVYLLDANQGRILRVSRSGQGYEIDPSFNCGPGKYASIIVGNLIDISALPPTNFAKATIMGMDANGNVLYCSPTEKPAAITLPAPDTNWGKPTRAIYFQDNLYVLDAQVNQVFYFQVTDGEFRGGPRLYFAVSIPHLSDVVDMAVDQEYLYLLHEDGSMTTCNNSGANATCDDPAPYGDERSDHDPEPLKFAEAKFILTQATQPPDPSLYILDSKATSIYQFSLRKLNLQRQFQPLAKADYPPADKTATAFVITPNRRALVATGNQLYFALLK
jgi:hypothetical protein